MKLNGRGIRVMGALTCSNDPEWKYINIRRLLIFLEKSIYKGTQWVIFEPNDNYLWAYVKQRITSFLTEEWAKGALMGRTPDEAFFVDISNTTMTSADINDGKLVCMVGVAPIKPSEFY